MGGSATGGSGPGGLARGGWTGNSGLRILGQGILARDGSGRGHDVAYGLNAKLDTRPIDIQMRANTHAMAADDGDHDAFHPHPVRQFVSGQTGGARIEEHQVGLGVLDRQPLNLRQAACQHAGIGMILGQAIDIVIQRIQARRGADAGLTE